MLRIIINLTSAPTSRKGSSKGQNAADRAHAWDKSSSVQFYISVFLSNLRHLIKIAECFSVARLLYKCSFLSVFLIVN